MGNITLSATCSCCGRQVQFELDHGESVAYEEYRVFGSRMGMLQDIFPRVPAWIRSGAIDKRAFGFTICPKCSGMEV